ncbi:hypothetical protein ACOMHN_040168 [Nucella lapillus]
MFPWRSLSRLFQDSALEEQDVADQPSRVERSGRVVRRLCLVLDCLLPHDFSPATGDYVNLQHYVIKEKKLTEREAAVIFYDIVRIVDNLHKKNIVHRDLKLGNMVLNKETRRVTVTNFCLGKHLVSESDLLRDQRGSPAYISPDVLSGKPYRGKPSDMWALGVVLFTMVYGQFPFYDSSPQELFRKIKGAEYSIPHDGRVSDATKLVIRRLLQLDSQMRMTASQVLDALGTIIAQWSVPFSVLSLCGTIIALWSVPFSVFSLTCGTIIAQWSVPFSVLSLTCGTIIAQWSVPFSVISLTCGTIITQWSVPFSVLSLTCGTIIAQWSLPFFVLSLCGTIIAQWRALTCTGPLQVVPDIDEDEDSDAESSSDTNTTNTANTANMATSSSSKDAVPAPGMSDLERKLLHLQSDLLTEQPKVRTLTRRRAGAPTTVTRLNTDAQRLSAAELHWYRHLAELRTPHS